MIIFYRASFLLIFPIDETFSNRKKDNNIFFNGLIAYTLNDIKSHVSGENHLIIDSILIRTKPLFAKFKNRKEEILIISGELIRLMIILMQAFLNCLGKK